MKEEEKLITEDREIKEVYAGEAFGSRKGSIEGSKNQTPNILTPSGSAKLITENSINNNGTSTARKNLQSNDTLKTLVK